jgi:hypothetical protein
MSLPTILEEALEITTNRRDNAYGHPRENHERIAALWNAYLECRPTLCDVHPQLSAEDVARMMILLKIVRDANQGSRDNLVDIAGYARCLERIRAANGFDDYVDNRCNPTKPMPNKSQNASDSLPLVHHANSKPS